MIVPIIYIYGKGNDIFNCHNFTQLLIEKFCLNNISDSCDSKVYLNGDCVDEIVFSHNLDYIKIDSSIEIFIDLILEFEKYFDNTYYYSIGFSGDPYDINPFPNSKNRIELEEKLGLLT